MFFLQKWSGKFHKYTEWNKKGALIILEISFEIIPNGIISYTREQFT